MEDPKMRTSPDGVRRADRSNRYRESGRFAKTAAYTVLLAENGRAFSNAGAGGPVTFTLPTDSTVPVGWWADFFVEAAQSLVLAAVSINNAATLTAAGTQNGIGYARVVMGGDGKYRAQLVGTWT